MATPSASLQCCGIKQTARALTLFAVALASPLFGQLTTGIVEGSLRDTAHRPVAGAAIAVIGAAGFHITLHSNSHGEFTAALPYGQYSIAAVTAHADFAVAPLQTVHIDLVEGEAAKQNIEERAGLWAARPRAASEPYAFSLPALLLSLESVSVTDPLDLTDASDNRLGIESQRGESWTSTRYSLQGIDATDSYQPGRTMILPNLFAMDEVVVRSTFEQSPSTNAGTEVGFFMAQPGPSWHASLSSADTGSALTSSNLPSSNLGLVQQNQAFQWMTRDGLEIGGPIGKRADIFASAWGQWASQTVPLQAPGTNQGSRLLFANVRGRIRITDKDQFEALYLGSRIDLSNFGEPLGIEALAGNRMMPFFSLPGGVPGQGEVDHLDFVQAAWSHVFRERGTMQIRYGYSTAHLDSRLSGQGPLFTQSKIELTTGAVSGAPPLGNFAIRTRQSFEGVWQPHRVSTGELRHEIAIGAGWSTASPSNRFTTPSNTNLVTAAGAPAFVIDFNTPATSVASIQSSSGWLSDRLTIQEGLAFDLSARAEILQGSVPGQSGTLISWKNIAPRFGFEWQLPHAHGFTLRGSYARLYSPLAGRYLDYGNPNSLSGEEYRWTDSNSNGWFDPGEAGPMIMRFGGVYSSISPTLRQPYSDRFSVGAAAPLLLRIVGSIQLFRVDQMNRIGALDTGVPAQAFSPVVIQDPGPDGIPGTSDDRPLTVYSQNPATFGQDRYLLTNPAGLKFRNSGFSAEMHSQWRGLTAQASFTAEKSYGPTNPGNTSFENDPGVVGSLFLDPNTAINAANRSYTDRAYVGKIDGTYRIPWGGLEVSGIATYTDGLAFARLLLVQGLAQGPVLVDATVRGSPEGGNRTEHLLNVNMGLRREFRLPIGRLTGLLEVMNILNAAHKIQENDLTGSDFNLRLPVALQAPRTVRTGFVYTF